MREFFDVLDTEPAVHDRPNATDPGRRARAGRIPRRRPTRMTGGSRRCWTCRSRVARRDHRAGRPDRGRKIDGARAAAPHVRSAVRLDYHRRHRHPRHEAHRAPPQHRRGVPGRPSVQPLDRREPEDRQARGRNRRDQARGRARPGARLHRERPSRLRQPGRRARPAPVGRRAPAPRHRPRAAQGRADPDPRRGHQRARRQDRKPCCWRRSTR